jgi:predicted solute-binding protein
MRLGCVSYINALPFTLPLSQAFPLTLASPNLLNNQLRDKQLDVALSSSLQKDYSHVEGYGIVGLGKVFSVNLYTSLSTCDLNGAHICLTQQSYTAVGLLKVLCYHYWNVSPYFLPESSTDSCDGYLLIGDQALLHKEEPGFQVIDLATIWYEMTGLPFVFALFLARKEISASNLEKLQEILGQALTWSESHPEEIERAAQLKCPLNLERVRAYYSVLGYRLGNQEIESLNLFRKLYTDVPTICS